METTTTFLSGLTVENIPNSTCTIYSGYCEVDACEFRQAQYGIYGFFSGGAEISNCRFSSMWPRCITVIGPCPSVRIVACEFVDSRIAVQFNYASAVNCDMEDVPFLVET